MSKKAAYLDDLEDNFRTLSELAERLTPDEIARQRLFCISLLTHGNARIRRDVHIALTFAICGLVAVFSGIALGLRGALIFGLICGGFGLALWVVWSGTYRAASSLTPEERIAFLTRLREQRLITDSEWEQAKTFINGAQRDPS